MAGKKRRSGGLRNPPGGRPPSGYGWIKVRIKSELKRIFEADIDNGTKALEDKLETLKKPIETK